MEELWEKGEAGGDFDSTPRIIEPEHFECMFMIMGCIFSVHLIVLLWDILSNPSFGFIKLTLAGLFSCLLITFVNLYLFSTAFLTPITFDNGKGDIFMGEYMINMEKLKNNKTVALAIFGYGAVTSFIFIFIGTMRSLGITDIFLIIYISSLILFTI